MIRILLFIGIFCSAVLLRAQDRRDQGVFREMKTHYYKDVILEDIKEARKRAQEKKPRRFFRMDFSGMNLPTDPSLYTQYWHNEPISQGNTGTCWSYSTTSFYESEVFRLTGKKVKLSQMYTVYWEYVERARYFVRNRGKMHLGEGSETNAPAKIWKLYGIVPQEVYGCTKPGWKFPDHSDMYSEIEGYLKSVKEQNAWNEDRVVATVQSILNHHLGTPPTTFQVEGKTYTPKTYLNNYLEIKPDDYVDFMSLMEQPYWEQVLYDVPDNWWRSRDYHNMPLGDFVDLVKSAIENGYTMAIGGDVSEAGLDGYSDVAMVPSFDIPSDYIDEHARQFRFSNKTTTDDHAIHLVGYYEQDGDTWFLIKDSGSGARNGEVEGYYFYHEDFVKLKMMTFTIHKDAAKEYLKKFNKT